MEKTEGGLVLVQRESRIQPCTHWVWDAFKLSKCSFRGEVCAENGNLEGIRLYWIIETLRNKWDFQKWEWRVRREDLGVAPEKHLCLRMEQRRRSQWRREIGGTTGESCITEAKRRKHLRKGKVIGSAECCMEANGVKNLKAFPGFGDMGVIGNLNENLVLWNGGDGLSLILSLP